MVLLTLERLKINKVNSINALSLIIQIPLVLRTFEGKEQQRHAIQTERFWNRQNLPIAVLLVLYLKAFHISNLALSLDQIPR